MPALFRTMAIIGAVCFGILAVPAVAQISPGFPSLAPPDHNPPTVPVVPPPASSMPPSDATPSPAPADLVPAPPTPAPAASAPNITPPTMAAPAADKATPTPASKTSTKAAATTHQKKVAHASKKHKKDQAASAAKKSSGDSKIRDAQTHLINLGYYKGASDGRIGPKTRAAIRKFQQEHKLRVDGKLSKATYIAIVVADKDHPTLAAGDKPSEASVSKTMEPMPVPNNTPPPPDFYATHPDFYGYYNQSYDNALQLGPTQTLYSRFARVDLNEDSAQAQQPGAIKHYNIMLNGLPLILVDGQPSVVGVSKTFVMGNEDVMIFTSYKDHDPLCAYTYNLLILSADGTRSREIHNCTRGFEAKLTNGSLFITFPQQDADRAVGATWRYEKGDLEKL